MSDEDKPLEFSARDLMPAWAQDAPSSPEKSYAKRFENEEGEGDRRGGGRRDDRRGGGFPGRGGQGGGGGARDDRRGPRPEGRGGDRGRDRRGGDRGGDRRGGSDRDFRDRPREDLPAVGITTTIEPSKPAIEGLTKHIKETLRAFPLADLAKMILNARERYQVRFSAQDERRLYRCPADGSVWLSREEAITHLLNSPAIGKFYVAEDVEVGAPSGNFNVVAVCGLSGTILGPPNHHEYQRNIVRLHQERFANMSLERFKSRIQMESGEEAIERWKEQVSRVRQYRLQSDVVVLEKKEEMPVPAPEEPKIEEVIVEEAETEVGAEASEETVAPVETSDEEIAAGAAPENEEETLVEENDLVAESDESVEDSSVVEKPAAEGLVIKSNEELARHFRQNYAEKAVREVKEAVVPGDIPGRLLSSGLLAHLRQEGERLRRGFPLDLIQTLCRDLEKKGLKFFKRGRKALHVAAVRPREIDPAVTLTEQIQHIVDFVIASPRTTVAGMLKALVPDFKMPEKGVEAAVELSEDSKTVLKNLRWLTSEGYVLEFPDTSLTIGREPQKGDKTAPATAKKNAPKKKKASPPKEATEPTPEAEVSPAQDDEGYDSSDPILEIDTMDEDSSGVDELPESVNPVENF